MDRIFQWVWDRYGSRYSWAICAVIFPPGLFIFGSYSMVVVAFERSDRFLAALVVTALVMALRVVLIVLPGSRELQLMEKWAAGHDVDRAAAVEGTFTYARKVSLRVLVADTITGALLGVLVGVVAGASHGRLIQYGIVGVAFGAAVGVINMHSFVEGSLRPARAAIAGDTGVGDHLPRSRPTFATWSSMSLLAVAFVFCVAGATLASVIDRARVDPVVSILIAGVVTLVSGQIAVMVSVPYLRPIRDLAEGTERVAVGDYSQRLPVVQDDDLGALAASFNRMQAGLAERQRLQAAFGTYVDPALATRLIEQGDDLFRGERREVTVMFVDVRNFTPFAEANTAEDTVARLNALFEIIVPAVVTAGGHVNRFLGDGAMAVFGAPNDLVEHADAAVSTAVLIQRGVAEQFGGSLRIGIGINTGEVIAGTIGGGGHLEFAVIGDTTNVAARIEQLTKTTGDAILITQRTADRMTRRDGLIDRGSHALKGKSDAVRVFGLAP